MTSLKQRLFDELERGGFCQDTLRQLEKICLEASRSSTASQISGYDDVVLNVLGNFCYKVADYLNALEPVTVEQHSKIEQAMAEPLRGVIECLDNKDAGASMKAFRVLINAHQEMVAA